MKLRRLALALALLLLPLLPLRAAAAEDSARDASATGSVTARTLTRDGKPVTGGSLTIYSVALRTEGEQDDSLVLTEAFLASGANLDEIKDAQTGAPELAARLAQFARTEGLRGQTAETDQAGVVTFPDLPLGLYLVVQDLPAPGYEAVSPFLVTVPMEAEGRMIYDVDATPKLESLRPTEPTEPTEPAKPDKELPKTGQLWWPVPMLLAAGILFLSLGILMGKRHD